MKKINYGVLLIFVAGLFGSCAVGTYVPHAVNLTGTQTTVVLDKANFRVVRNVEAVVEVDNDRLRRADVEKSAFAELTRKYPLTGSQAYVNVVFDEVQREKVFAFHYGRYRVKQYVAVRATIIEFLQDNGQPIQSVTSPYTESAKASSVPQSTQETQQSPKEEEEEVIIDPSKREANEYYLALLYKQHRLSSEYMNEITSEFNYRHIMDLASKTKTAVLLEKSKDHEKRLEKHAIRK